MKLKMLAVLTLVVFGCAFASAQSFGFASTYGGLYCNYEQLSYYGGGLWAGSDNLSACGSSYNSTISGFTASAKGAEAHGPGVVYGDTIYAQLDGLPTFQWTVFTKLKCNKQNKYGQYTGSDGWEGVAGASGYFLGTNQGPLSCSLPGKHGVQATKGVNTKQKN